MSDVLKKQQEENQPVDLVPLFAEALEEYKQGKQLDIRLLAEAYGQWLMARFQGNAHQFFNHRDYLECVGCPPEKVEAVMGQVLTDILNNRSSILQMIHTVSDS